jgi:hypothetical protein
MSVLVTCTCSLYVPAQTWIVSPLEAAVIAALIVLKLGLAHEPPLTPVGTPVVDTYHVLAAWALSPPNIISAMVNVRTRVDKMAIFFKFI